MVTIDLQYPITSSGVEIKTLKLRRVTVADLEIMGREKTDIGKSIRLLSLLAEMDPEDIRRMDALDFNKASEEIEGFLE